MHLQQQFYFRLRELERAVSRQSFTICDLQDLTFDLHLRVLELSSQRCYSARKAARFPYGFLCHRRCQADADRRLY